VHVRWPRGQDGLVEPAAAAWSPAHSPGELQGHSGTPQGIPPHSRLPCSSTPLLRLDCRHGGILRRSRSPTLKLNKKLLRSTKSLKGAPSQQVPAREHTRKSDTRITSHPQTALHPGRGHRPYLGVQ